MKSGAADKRKVLEKSWLADKREVVKCLIGR